MGKSVVANVKLTGHSRLLDCDATIFDGEDGQMFIVANGDVH